MSTYKDLDLSFKAHPITGDLIRKIDDGDVKQSIKNIVMTQFYSRPMESDIGTNVDKSLFGLGGPFEAQQLEKEIETAINNFEPRAELNSVRVGYYENTYHAKVSFYILNQSEPVDLVIALERTR